MTEANGLFFEYGEEEIRYLKERDARLAEVIDRVRKINHGIHKTICFTAWSYYTGL